jgi:GT2 family glycosyltransferase
LSAVSGACLAVWKKTFEQVGGMDEKFSTSLYDVDFCLRVKTLGLRNVWTPFAELNLPRCLPDVAVVGRNERMQYDLLFRSRWASWLEHDPAYNPNLSLEAPGGFRLAWPPRESRTNPIYQREH